MTSVTRLGWALGGSLVAHAALWMLLPHPGRAALRPPPGAAAGPVSVRVQLLEDREPPPAPLVLAVKKGTLSGEGLSARSTRQARAASVAVSIEPAETQGEGLEGEGRESGDPEGAAQAPSAVVSVGGGGTGEGPATSSAELAALHERLAVAARACYPDAALRFRLSGEVELAFCAGPGGRSSGAHLRGSTGSAILDRAAEECVLDRAQPLPVNAGCFHLPVRFGMP